MYFIRLECPQDWILHGNSCYHVIDTPTLNWSDARTTCQNLGGDLAIIRSQDENNFIIDILNKQQRIQDLGAWIGLYRKADNMFYWIDDTPLAGQYSTWANGKPDSQDEKCANIFMTGSRRKYGKWNDLTCNLPEASKSKSPVVLCKME